MDRRHFLQFSGMALAAIPFARRLSALSGAPALGAADLPPAKETDEPAKSLKFCANADKPSKNCAARKDKAKAGEYCYSCQLFTKTSGEKKDAKGKCLIMPKNSVPGNAWCQSWVQNPAVPT